MEKNDGLSEIICKKCLARLQIAYDFKKVAIASNRELRSFISNVNKQFQQVTGSSGVKSNKRTRSQEEGNESFDELDEDMQDLLDEEQETADYKDLDGDSSDENKKTIDRDQLVEILGDNSAISIRKSRERSTLSTVQEDGNDDYPEDITVFLVDENSEVESGFIVDESDQNAGELITDETDEPQYLDDDENDDQMYDAVSFNPNNTTKDDTKF